MPIAKWISCGKGKRTKKYIYYDKYYTKEEALKEAIKLKTWNKEWGKKVRTYIEKIQEIGTPLELFIPTTKYYLWINGE